MSNKILTPLKSISYTIFEDSLPKYQHEIV